MSKNYILFLIEFSIINGCEYDSSTEWFLATPSSLNYQGSYECFEYKYEQDANTYYLSPEASITWSWTSFFELQGTYHYTDGTGLSSFDCYGGENNPTYMTYGIGCSTGTGESAKLIPVDTAPDPINAVAKICEDVPHIFSSHCPQPLLPESCLGMAVSYDSTHVIPPEIPYF
eukprot:103986_1